MYMEPATFCWAECIRYFLFSSTCRVRRSLMTAWTHHLSVCLSICCFYPVNIEANGKVLSFSLFGRGSLLLLLQADQNLVLHLLYIEHVLGGQSRKWSFTLEYWLSWSLQVLTSCRTYLRVLQERGLVVDTASWPIAEGVLAVDPGAPHHLLFPGFMDAQVGCVDEAAQDQVGEVLTEVIKCHPAGQGDEQWWR